MWAAHIHDLTWVEGNGGLLNAKESFVHSFDTA